MIRIFLLSSLFITLFSTHTIAGEPGSLDKKSRKIITDRVCKRHASKQYTENEEWVYTWNLVANNMNFRPKPKVDLEAVGVEYARIFTNYNEIMNESNNLEVDREARAILRVVDRRCK